MNTKQERLIRSELKSAALREIANGKWSYNDLLTIFGGALRAKFEEVPTRDQLPGKHTLNRRDRVQHPAGTKLARRFIRHSGRESTSWRNLYFALTGKHYGTTGASS